MKIEFRKSFVEDIKAVTDKSLSKKLKEIIEAAESAATLNDLPNLKKLKGDHNHFRVRIGDYRLGLALDDDTLIFVRFLHRKGIYKFFP